MTIFAILLNPTIDQIYEIENFKVGGTFKVQSKSIFPVGKAISFALGVRELAPKNEDLEVVALIGKEDKSLYSHFLELKKIKFNLILVEGQTRSNKTINDPLNNTTTHIREQGFEVHSDSLESVREYLLKIGKKDDICVFSGSLPPNSPTSTYFNLIEGCKKQNIITALDSSGPALIEGVRAHPTIIKPNLKELSQILDKPPLNEGIFQQENTQEEALEKIIERAKPLIRSSIEILLITLGSKGAICITKNHIFTGNIQLNKVIDTVGSGDAFLAGFILKVFYKKPIKVCFKNALASGAANTQTVGPGILKREIFEKLLDKVKMKEIQL